MTSQTALALGDTEPIREFKGEHRFLSNFWMDGTRVLPEGPWWMTEVCASFESVEHAYQAAKVQPGTPHAVEHYAAIARAAQPGGEMRPDPGLAKRLGSAAGFGGARATLRPDWEQVKVPVMLACLRAKFAHVPNWDRPSDEPLWRALVATSPRVLVEGNTWGDTYWGVCGGRGSNMLGRCLMLVRSELLVAAAAGIDRRQLWPS